MKMKVDIWSDVRCPFCFVGKRKFEKALQQFPHADNISITWHSFQLDPTLKTQPNRDAMDFFTEAKNISLAQAEQMHEHAKKAGKEAGIDFNFEHQKVANSFRAHLLIQLAKTKNLGNEIEEALFHAQFIDAKNIDDVPTLVQIGKSVGLDENEIQDALVSDDFKYRVNEDQQMAQQLGINAVPFFVLNDKYGVSGAQQPELFLEVLQKAYDEFAKGDGDLKILSQGDHCDCNGNCH